jgi:N-methylhydantoinase B
MDHGRTGPQGVLGGADGAPNEVTVWRGGVPMTPEHLSKAQDIPLAPGDRVRVKTPGGGGYGDPFARDPGAVASVLAEDGAIDPRATAARRAARP